MKNSTSDNKALKSGIWYTVSNFITKGIGIITIPIFTRLMTHEEFGYFNNYISWLAILTIIVTLFMESTFISARYDFPKKFDEYICSVLSLSTVSVFAWGFIINIEIRYFENLFEMNRYYINSMLVYLLFLPAINMFQSRERYNFEYKVSVFISIFLSAGTSILSVMFVLLLKKPLQGRILGYIIPTILLGMFIYLYIFKLGKCIHVKYWKYALRICLPYVPHLLSLSLLNSMDKVMITKICGNEKTALYSLAYSCGMLVTMLITSLNSAFSPWLAEQLNLKNYNKIRMVSMKYIYFFSYVTVGILLISPEILLILGGKTYSASVYVMPPVTMGCLCQFIYTMFVNVEQFKKKTLGMAIASLTAASINYVLNLLFIPKFGYIVAAYTTLIGFFCLLVIHMFLVWRIGLSCVYNYKVIILLVLIFLIITTLTNFFYHLLCVRICILLIYTAGGFLYVKNYKQKIMSLIRTNGK